MDREPDHTHAGPATQTPDAPPERSFEEGAEAAPPGVRVMEVVRWILLLAVIAAAFSSVHAYVVFARGQDAPSARRGARYFCPMHPQITSDHTGECPICHMALEPMPEHAPAPVPVPGPASPPVPAPTGAPSMRPAGVSASAPKAETTPSPPPPAAPPDTTPITLALDRTQAIGVRTALVERRGAPGSIRATAAVEVPEQGRAEVHVRAPGFVESISVRDVGVKVKAGEALAAVYSPEVLQAQHELLTIRSWTTPSASPSDASAPPPTAIARKKLELLGVGAATVDRILATGQPIRAVGVSSPISGYVTRKDVVLGSYVMPDKVLFEVADLGRVYVVASLYAHQLAGVRAGDEATFTTPLLSGRSFATRVELVYPEVDLATRTARVRFRIDNGDLALRPGQFGTIELRGKGAEALTIPMDAVVDTGRSVYVFLAEDGGRFVARSVELGASIDGRFVVESGLQEGQRVVSGATFLIDAESRLQASLAASSRGP